ncbi:DUF5682 family protein [Streptomyces sp. SM14]|uniref:DUF5682 family protein n=1 Tax=Streptomyces sp. SM14 TaxID=1736045 RepID=UPI001C71C2BE|nr:DUF5682 family protein [Streptomyces sp. SM14]
MTAGPLLLGIRHHGPGSARAVRAALEARRPSVLLVEGPPEADAVVELAADKGMVPPVALVAHATQETGRAAFWPLASFSPEWIAIRWALDNRVPVRFIDLPAAHTLAEPDRTEDEATGTAPEPAPGDGEGDGEGVGDGDAEQPAVPGAGQPEGGEVLRIDPLAVLAEAAGYDDPERWWEDVVEHRGDADDPIAPFTAVEEAMTELRAAHGDGGHRRDPAREAHMRLRLREARKEFGDEAVAVVCGAWHVPALREQRTVTADRALLKGLPKVRTEVTWVPWTHRRLGRASGYGAGIDSPGWYGHLFDSADRPIARWMTKIAGLFRDEGRPISSAHVIEAVRLAETLAVMRGRPLAGLGETLDAVRSVMCEGSDVPLALIQDRLIVGDVLGEVPDAAPAVPLQRDLTALQRSLRLKPEAGERELDLDLRKENDAARSRLLYRLGMLSVPWGRRANGSGTGTFRERWRLEWQPELAVRVAEAGIWGTTVEDAAGARARSDAAEATTLAELTTLAESCLLAGLDEALPEVMRALADRAALDSDVGRLAAALPALVRSVRYGDVRATGGAALRRVAEGLAERVCVGLAPASSGLDAAGAAELRGHIESAHSAIGLLDDEELRGRWRAALRRLTERQATPALLRGRAARLLLDEGELPEEDAERLMGLELSPGNPPAQAAGWVEGFLAGGGLLLVHDERLLGLLDAWLSAVPRDSFEDVLPLLRRTFTAFDSGVRRSVGELARRGPGRGTGTVAARGHFPGFGEEPDTARADAVLPVLRLLLGTPPATPSVTPSPTDRSTTTASSPAAAPAVAPIGASS